MKPPYQLAFVDADQASEDSYKWWQDEKIAFITLSHDAESVLESAEDADELKFYQVNKAAR